MSEHWLGPGGVRPFSRIASPFKMRFVERRALATGLRLVGVLALWAASTGAQSVTVSPASTNFGSEVVGGTSSAKTFTVQNGQSTPLTILSITVSGDFLINGSKCPISPSTLAASKSCTFTVEFQPTATGTRTGTASVNDDATGSPQTASLSGTGTPQVTPTPSSLSFGSIDVGVTSIAKTVTLANASPNPVTINSVVISGEYQIEANSCPISPATLGGNSNCSVSVVFAPASPGTQNGTLMFNDSAANSPQTTSLTGTGLGIKSIAVTPTAPTIAAGTTEQFTATATYSGGVKQNLTGVVAWSTTNAPVATISNTPGSQGVANGLGQGSANITATFGGVSGSTLLTVGPPSLVSIALTPANPTIAPGTGEQFTATGTYSDGSTQNLTNTTSWTSSNNGAATISNANGQQGLASGVGQGSTTITARAGSVSGSTLLTVSAPTLLSIAVSPSNGSVAPGTTQQFTAIGTFSDGSTQNLTNSVQWNSSSSAQATISNTPGTQGLAASATTGPTTISASLGSVTGSTGLTVTSATLVSISVTPAVSTVPLGINEQFAATGTFSDGSTQDVTTVVQWGSSTTGVATISNTTGTLGLASAVGSGSSTISATSGAIYGSTTLTVTAATLASIAVSPANPQIATGTTEQFTATGTFTDGSTQNLTGMAIWGSSNASVAGISPAGLATGASAGSSTITASLGGTEGSVTLAVSSATLVSITVSPASQSIAPGTSQQLTAIGTFSDGSQQNLTNIAYWTSSNGGAGPISDSPPTVGLVNGLSAGTTTIVAIVGSVIRSATLTVTSATLASLAVSPQNAGIQIGGSEEFTATGTFSDGSSQNVTTSVAWASSAASVAIVSNNSGTQGLATSAGAGTATIGATWGSVTSSTQLTVTIQAQLVSIAIAPVNATVFFGGTQQFTATGKFSDGSTQDLTASSTWSSANTSVASINATGLATAAGVGVTSITATNGSISGSTNLTVIRTLTSIGVTPANPSIAAGLTVQFTAIGYYSDGSTQYLTSSAAWASSNAAVATISNATGSQGLATSLTPGTVTISATSGLTTGTATLTVTTASLVSISISPPNADIYVGQTQQFIATGLYTDGSTANVTAMASWDSSATEVTVQTSGQANPGLASASQLVPSEAINAMYGGQNAYAIVTTARPVLPINDLGTGLYLGLYQGGFYPGGSNVEPAQHGADGSTFAAQIQPVDLNGNPSSSGQIALVGEGMSVALDELGGFSQLEHNSNQVSPSIYVANEAESNNDACTWTVGTPGVQPTCCTVAGNQCAKNALPNPPANHFDRICASLLANRRSCNQVQAVWIDNSNGTIHPYLHGCFSGGSGSSTTYVLCSSLDPNNPANNSYQLTDALNLEWELGQEIRASKLRFPNLKQVFLSSRAFAGYCQESCASPEPEAYEVGFAVKWLIQAQITQCPTSACPGPIDPIAGDMGYTNAAWVDWSYDTSVTGLQQSYLWANEDFPRSDGLVWCDGGPEPQPPPCGTEEDYNSGDWLHLSTLGATKAGQLMMNFFLYSTWTKSWFAK